MNSSVALSGLVPRLITALVLIPLVVFAVLLLPTDMFRWGVVVLAALAIIEWARLAGLESGPGRALYFLLVTAYFLLLGAAESLGAALVLSLPMAVFWILFILVVALGRKRPVNQSGKTTSFALLLFGPLLIGVAGVALVGLHRLDAGLTLFLLFMIWIADSAAYFSGRSFGRNRLAPAISPGKTVEGVVGALVAVTIYAFVFALLNRDFSGLELGLFLVLCLLTTMVSVVGDLFESLIKRHRGVKDSGRILPGHGGILDRIDSLIAAAPVFFVGYGLVEVL
jgi:phosphatidate cytidylyltransferase